MPLAFSARGGSSVPPTRTVPARRRRTRLRGAALALAAVPVAVAALAGCSKFDAAMGQQWATVTFKPTTSVATLLKVRTACSHVPNVHPEALPKKRTAGTMMYALTYRTDKASDANLAQLQQCLQRFPSVQGVDFQDSGDEG